MFQKIINLVVTEYKVTVLFKDSYKMDSLLFQCVLLVSIKLGISRWMLLTY